jgi:hypothetical protein
VAGAPSTAAASLACGWVVVPVWLQRRGSADPEAKEVCVTGRESRQGLWGWREMLLSTGHGTRVAWF